MPSLRGNRRPRSTSGSRRCRRHALPGRRLALEVEQQVGGPGIAVARLAHRPGVEQEGAAGKSDLGVGGRKARDEIVARIPVHQRHVAVANQRELRRLQLETDRRGVIVDHILPDGVADAAVVELHARSLAAGRQRAEDAHRLGGDRRGGPARRRSRVGGEHGDVDRVGHNHVVVSGETGRRAGVDRGHAGVGVGAVADQIAEAPDLIDAGLIDPAEHRGQRGKIGVDVRDDGDSASANAITTWCAEPPYRSRWRASPAWQFGCGRRSCPAPWPRSPPPRYSRRGRSSGPRPTASSSTCSCWPDWCCRRWSHGCWRGAAGRAWPWAGSPVVQGGVRCLLVSLITTAVVLPIGYVAMSVRSNRGLDLQSTGAWLETALVTLVITAVRRRRGVYGRLADRATLAAAVARRSGLRPGWRWRS